MFVPTSTCLSYIIQRVSAIHSSHLTRLVCDNDIIQLLLEAMHSLPSSDRYVRQQCLSAYAIHQWRMVVFLDTDSLGHLDVEIDYDSVFNRRYGMPCVFFRLHMFVFSSTDHALVNINIQLWINQCGRPLLTSRDWRQTRIQSFTSKKNLPKKNP